MLANLHLFCAILDISPRKELSRSLSSDNWRSRKDEESTERGREREQRPEGEEPNNEGDWRRAGPRDKCESLSLNHNSHELQCCICFIHMFIPRK